MCASCREILDRLFEVHGKDAQSDDVCIPDEEDELNWHSFLGHHDFWRFRGDLFFLGGRKGFLPLRKQHPPLGVPFLAAVWQELVSATGLSGTDLVNRYGGGARKGDFKSLILHDLRSAGRNAQEYARLIEEFRSGTARHHAVILGDASILEESFGGSFRIALEQGVRIIAPQVAQKFPAFDWTQEVTYAGERASVEKHLAAWLYNRFYVGYEVAWYLFCDWLLGLWKARRIPVFHAFKYDVHAKSFASETKLYDPGSRWDFCGLALKWRPDLPPRALNECIWLHGAQSCDCLNDLLP